MTTLQIIDPATAAVLWDFGDDTGTGAWAAEFGGIRTGFALGGSFDLSSPDLQAVRFEPPASDGGTTLMTRRALVTSSFRARMRATSAPNLRLAVARLQQLMEAGGVMAYIFPGETEPVYIDYEPSPAPALLAGRPLELYHVSNLFDTPEGVLIAFVRQPTLHGPERNPTVNALVNSTLLVDSNADGRPDLWTWDSTIGLSAESIAAPGEAYNFTIATATALNLQQTTAVGSAAPADVWSGSFYARRMAGGTAKCRVVLRFCDSTGAVLGTDSLGTLTSLTMAWQRLTVTSSAAPALTSRIRISLQVDNDDATSTTMQWRFPQAEKFGSVSAYRGGEETLNNDPATAGLGRVLPVWIDGSAPTHPRLLVQGTVEHLTWGVRSRGPIAGARSLTAYLNAAKFEQIEGWTLDTPDTAAAADVNASPQSGNTHAATAFATATHIQRATVAQTNAAKLAAWAGGTWRVLLRCALSVTSTTVTLQLKWKWGLDGDATDANEGAQVTFTPTTTGYHEVDLGLVTFPDQTPDGVELYLFAGRTAGTGTLKSDLISFVPASSHGKASYGIVVADTFWTEVDAEAGTFQVLDANLAITRRSASLRPVTNEGAFPVLQPGLNMLYIGPPPGSVYGITTTYKVRAYYQPHYHG